MVIAVEKSREAFYNVLRPTWPKARERMGVCVCPHPAGNHGAQLISRYGVACWVVGESCEASRSNHVETDTWHPTCFPKETSDPMRLVIKRRNNRVIIINLLYPCSPHRKAQHDIDTCTGAGRNYFTIFLDSFIIALEFLFRVVWVLFFSFHWKQKCFLWILYCAGPEIVQHQPQFYSAFWNPVYLVKLTLLRSFNTWPTIYRRILNLCTDFMTNLLVTGTPVFSRALFSFPPATVHRMELLQPLGCLNLFGNMWKHLVMLNSN